MKKQKLFKRMVTGILAATLCISSMSMAAPDGYEDFTNPIDPYTYGENEPLYAATHFHVFASDSASTQTHCNGNIATPLFSQNSNSGSRQENGDEVTYIGKLITGSGADFGSNTEVVFGKDTKVYTMNKTEVFVLTDDGKTLKKTESKKTMVFTEDPNNPYINFDKEFKDLTRLSVNLPKEQQSSSVKYYSSGSNENTIEIDSAAPDTTHYINVSPADFKAKAFIVKGTNFTQDQALVINVNLGTMTNYTIPFHQVLLYDKSGSAFGTGEDKGVYTGHGNLLWNFYGTDAQGNIIPYTGTINTCNEFKGSILAPQATIQTASSNQDGNFIGKVVKLAGGETHRWDFGGTLPRYSDLGSLVVKTYGDDDKTITVEDVELQIVDSNNIPVATLTTGANGSTDILESLKINEGYKVIVKDVPYGYRISAPTEYPVTITEANPDVVEIILEKDADAYPATKGYFQVIVKEKSTGNAVSGATVTITDPESSSVTMKSGNETTNANGIAESEEITATFSDTVHEIPGYKIAVTVPEGYTETSLDKTVSLTEANPTKIVFEVEKKVVVQPGKINVTVIDKDTNNPVSNSVAQIIDKYGIIKEVTITTNNSNPGVENLTLQDGYRVVLTKIPDGYKLVEPANKEISSITLDDANKEYSAVYKLEKEKGSLDAIIKEEISNTPIPGAKVEVIDENNTVINTQITDSNGEIKDVTGLDAGDYIVHVVSVPDGYKEPADMVVTIKGTEKANAEFTVKKAGTIEVTVKDPVSNKNIQNAKVNIVDSSNKVVDTLITNANGETPESTKLLYGDYKVVVVSVPSGYTKPADVPTTVNSPSKVVPLQVTPVGSMIVTVVDPNLNVPIEDAVVDIVDSSDKVIVTMTTKEDGTTDVIPNLPYGDYKVVTTTVPSGYTAPAPSSATVNSNTAPTKVELEITKTNTTPVTPPATETGAIKVTITDKNDPNKPIPGATVEIQDKDGKVVETVVTDKNGTTPVVDELKKGDTYTIVTTKVPDGYTAPTPTTQKIETTETVEVKLVVEKGNDDPTAPALGSLFVIITDKNTGAVIPEALVKVTDSKGNLIKEIKTAVDGTFTITGLTPDTYTITTITVPEGYTAPDAETAVVVANQRTDKHLYVMLSASVDTPIKTGDDAKLSFATIMCIIAMVGMVLISLKRRKASLM